MKKLELTFLEWRCKKLYLIMLLFTFLSHFTVSLYGQVNTGGTSTTSNHNKQVIGYITNWDAWKQSNAGVPAQGALTHLNIDYAKYTILNYSFFGVAVDGSLHSGDHRNKQIYQQGTVQQPADLLYTDIYSSWDMHILFGEIDPLQHINEAAKQRAEAQGFQVELNANTWSHPGWGLSGPLPLPLHKEDGAPGLLELAHQKGVKVMASIGGWSMCKHFPEMAADPVKRARFIEDCKKLINMGFDGIDLDWEYPGPYAGMNFTGTQADFANFENLVQEIRNAIGPTKLITAAMSADPRKLQDFNWSQLANTMDYFNMMTYDFNGGWSNIAGHNAPVYPYDGAEAPDFNWQSTLNALLAKGVPPGKINFGIPFYGRGVVTDGAAALNAPTVKRNVTIQPDGPVSTSADYTNWPQEVYDGTPNHFFIKQKTGTGSGWTRHWDNQAQVPYMTNGNFFLSYDDEESIGIKAQYINDNNLAGTIVWTVYGDLEMSGSVESFGTKLKRWSNVKSPLINTVNQVFANGGGGGNTPPTVAITSPQSGDTFIEGATISIAANASDSDGTITKVEFYNGNTLLGEKTSAPYTFDWASVAAGNYTIAAKAYDNDNSSSTASVSITVNSNGNQLPTVSITSPQSGATYTDGDTISISADASDPDGTISKVEFYNGTTLLGQKTSAPYTFDWASVAVGSYTINVKATDNDGGTAEDTVSVTVNEGGGGSCTAPAWVAGQAYFGGAVVSFQGHEYRAKWWVNQSPAESDVWEDLGPCDGGGNNTAPTVSVTSPQSGSSFTTGDVVTISADANDTDGTISKVEFLVDGNVISEDTTSPYTTNWTSTEGNHSITARATDNENAATTSGSVSISVTSDTGNQSPTVSITNPANGATFTEGQSINITADANDTDGTVSSVTFFVDGNSIGEDTSAPYSATWVSTVGNHNITAVAQDNDAASTTSSVISITVQTDTGGGDCNDPQYVENGGYVAGSQVQNEGNLYECKPHPFSGWCNGAAWAYAPGTGEYWQDAWELVGDCSGSRNNISSTVSITKGSSIKTHPNPLQGETNITFQLMDSQSITAAVYNQIGMKIAELANYEKRQPGNHTIKWTSEGFPSGLYFLKIQIGKEIKTIKLIKE
ncbi:Ig-like domain-containing protein [Aquimarina sp. 2201CG5-10]|uniref:Ig-like domain-containing protein n=1 Tax=Aquimarina callyspongiae TaxID=3098150 RepID=UPI002AB5D52A|nr:Ig-like domain-containing protein [Aquimarina sp. 2201CG5-10]MDY8137996.1 Ig-like domain-containing protein [Aquimarina sp. 2201CG5-10]